MKDPLLETKLQEIQVFFDLFQVELSKLATTLPGISRVLTQVEHDVKHIPERIPVIQVPAPPIVEDPIPLSNPQTVPLNDPPAPLLQPVPPIAKESNLKSTGGPPETGTIHLSDDHSAHSIYSLTDQVRSEDIPTLESLLKKILKSRKRSPESDDKRKAGVTPMVDSVRELKQDIQLLRYRKDASTSPPPSHTRKDLEKRYRKSKPKKVLTGCECTSGYSQVSWICPGCITDSSQSIGAMRLSKPKVQVPNKAVPPLKPKDPSILFANDTSMIHPLAQIVAELEQEEAELDADDLEVLSSLNGFQ
jgi:hypothetical protein